VLPADELAAFLARLPEELVVALDEAYIEFVPGSGEGPREGWLDAHPRLCVLRTFSKLYGLAGLRIGYGFASGEMIDYMNRVRQPFNVNSLAQAAALAALDDTDFAARTLRLVRTGLGELYARLGAWGIEYLPTSTNFFLIRVPGGGKRVYQALLREGVIVRSMDSYGLPDYIRVSVGLPEENERFLEAFQKVLRR
jgi:histidinol-phosphate aminotransferase